VSHVHGKEIYRLYVVPFPACGNPVWVSFLWFLVLEKYTLLTFVALYSVGFILTYFSSCMAWSLASGEIKIIPSLPGVFPPLRYLSHGYGSPEKRRLPYGGGPRSSLLASSEVYRPHSFVSQGGLHDLPLEFSDLFIDFPPSYIIPVVYFISLWFDFRVAGAVWWLLGWPFPPLASLSACSV
jgi:hypothetical protein